MALCEGQLDSNIIKSEVKDDKMEQKNKPNNMNPPPPTALLSVDYRSPRSHFIPSEIEMYSNTHGGRSPERNNAAYITHEGSDRESSRKVVVGADDNKQPVKRKRGRPRIDKSSPEYIAKCEARQRAKELAMRRQCSEGGGGVSCGTSTPGEDGFKRKRGRPRVDKTSPEYLARRRQRELELMERRAQRQHRRRNTLDGVEPKKRGRKKKIIIGPDGQPIEASKRIKRRKSDLNPDGTVIPRKRGRPPGSTKIRNKILNNEPIPVDSDDDIGSPSQSDSLSLDENLRTLRHLHEKYANLHNDNYDMLAASCYATPAHHNKRQDDQSTSSSDDDSSSSGSESSSSGSSSSGSSSDSGGDSSESSDSGDEARDNNGGIHHNNDKARRNSGSGSESSVDAEGYGEPGSGSLSESENESPDKRFQCHICRKWYSTHTTLKIHRRVHLNRGSGNSRRRAPAHYECDVCLQRFSRREKLQEHRASAHRGSVTVRCEVCRRCFEDDNKLAHHTHTDDEKIGRCSECGLHLGKYELLMRHMLQAHGRSTSTPALHHQSTSPSSQLSCPQCSKSFTHPNSLARHLNNHANTVYRCVVCKQSFPTADQLATHLNSHLDTYKKLRS